MKKIFALIIMLLLTTGCSGVKKEDIIDYLNNKYGDEGFYFVSKKECNLFELGICSYSFSSTKLNGKEFLVSWKDNKGSEMSDTYEDAVYLDKLSEYYKGIFKGKFNFEYEIECISDRLPNVHLDNIDEKIKDARVSIKIRPNVTLSNNSYYHLKTNDPKVDSDTLSKAKDELEKYTNNYNSTNNVSSVVSSVINENNLSSISEVFLYINDCKEDEYVVSCSYIKSVYKKANNF